MTRSKSATILLVATMATACEHRQLTPTAPDNPGTTTNQGTEVKSVSSGNALVADVIVGDSGCPTSPSSLASTGPGDVGDFYHVQWRHTQGLIVTPAGSSYSLTDDVSLYVKLKPSDMILTAVRAVKRIYRRQHDEIAISHDGDSAGGDAGDGLRASATDADRAR